MRIRNLRMGKLFLLLLLPLSILFAACSLDTGGGGGLTNPTPVQLSCATHTADATWQVDGGKLQFFGPYQPTCDVRLTNLTGVLTVPTQDTDVVTPNNQQFTVDFGSIHIIANNCGTPTPRASWDFASGTITAGISTPPKSKTCQLQVSNSG